MTGTSFHFVPFLRSQLLHFSQAGCSCSTSRPKDGGPLRAEHCAAFRAMRWFFSTCHLHFIASLFTSGMGASLQRLRLGFASSAFGLKLFRHYVLY